MHPKEDLLQTYLNRNLATVEVERIESHLAECPLCQERAQALLDCTRQVNLRLSILDPQPAEMAPTINIARQRLQLKINQKESQSMFQKLLSPRLRPVWGALVIVLMLVVALSFPQVRAMASSFLGLFRVQKVAVVQVDPDAISDHVNYAGETMLDAFFSTATEETLGESVQNATVEEASAVAGIAVRVPAGFDPADVNISVEKGTRIKVTVDQPLLQGIFDETQMGINIPKELDGAVVTGEIPPTVFTSFDCETVEPYPVPNDPDDVQRSSPKAFCSELIQLASPTIDAPEGLDISVIGEGFLQLMGLSAEEAKNFSQTVDWATTLVIPVPQAAVYANVSVDGVEGVLLRQRSGDQYYVLLWAKDGVVYGLAGTGSNEQAIELANSLQ